MTLYFRFATVAALLLSGGVSTAQAARWSFEVRLDDEQRQLSVKACSATAQSRVAFSTGRRDAAAYRLAQRRDSGAELHDRGPRLVAENWQANECLHTRIDLSAASRSRGRRDARTRDDLFIVDPRHWLWRPDSLHSQSTIRFDLPQGWSASVPWARIDAASHVHQLGVTDADWPAHTVFGRFAESTLRLPGGTVRVALLPPWDDSDLPRIAAVAQALLGAYGRLPRADTQVVVLPVAGRRDAAFWGEVTRGGGSGVHLYVGADGEPDALVQDWTATHEFSHLLHPYLGNRGRWLSEGLASYYQNVLRARAGVLSAAEAWDRLEGGFSRGRRDNRSAGMRLEDASRRTSSLRTYMRVYWSGAAFWLEADVALRQRGSSLDRILNQYADCCLQHAGGETPEDYVAALDRLAGGDVFGSRFRRYANAREFPDTAAIEPMPRRHPSIANAIMRVSTSTSANTTP
jgi:hypothetical protein